MNKKISVIIPVYNVSNYLDRCLSTVINQTYKNLEIIIINDGSTDDSPDIIKKYQSMDNRIIVINGHNRGLSVARNKGLKIATGDYIAFVDSDDFIELTMYETMINAYEEQNCDLVYCDFKYFEKDSDIEQNDYKGIDYELIDGMEYKKRIFYNTVGCYVWMKLWQKSQLENIFFPENHTYEDIYVQYDLMKDVKKVCHIKKILYYYVQRPQSIVTDKNFLSFYDFFMSTYNFMLQAIDNEDYEFIPYAICYSINTIIRFDGYGIIGIELKKNYLKQYKTVYSYYKEYEKEIKELIAKNEINNIDFTKLETIINT